MITLKTEAEIQTLKEGGRILARILKALAKACRPGMPASELEELANRLILEQGARPAFKGYRPHASRKPFPASLCVSKNSVVVHGIPSPKVILSESDIVSLDLGIIYKKLVTDSAITISIGRISPRARQLLKITENALERAIKLCRPGRTSGDIGAEIEKYVSSHGFSVIRELVGHGVGYRVHEEPPIPNFGKPGTGSRLEPGMVLAIEPMVSMGGGGVVEERDGSFVTRDGSWAAHFEHTVAITKRGPFILTK